MDGAQSPCNQRYPAIDEDGNAVDAPYILRTLNPQDNTQQFHFYEKVPDGDPLPFVVVNNMKNDEIPVFGYKMLVLSVCNGIRDYGDVFNHGCVVSTTDFTDFYASEPGILVQTLLDGGGASEFLDNLKKTRAFGQHLDYAQKNY